MFLNHLTVYLFLFYVWQGVCGVHGGRINRVDPNHQLVIVKPAVRLHPEHHVLPVATNLRNLPPSHLLAQSQRTGTVQFWLVGIMHHWRP